MGRGRPTGFKQDPEEYKNRFQRFYYKHRNRLRNQRQELYACRKLEGLCVRCGKERVEGSNLFCLNHTPIK